MPSERSLRELQELLLAAALGGRPLPGAAVPLRMPDLPLILGGPAILLAADNVAGRPDPPGLPRPLRVVSEQDLRDEAAARGTVAYLRFPPPEEQDETVWLTLEARMIASQGSTQSHLLGGVRVGFRNDDGEWRVVEDPIAFAT